MSPEELDEARVEEARRRWNSSAFAIPDIATIAARLAREGWTPAEPVDSDILAFHAWRVEQLSYVEAYEGSMTAKAYLAGARMAREQERDRVRPLVDQAKAIIDQHARLLARLPLGLRADMGIEWQTMMDATAPFYAKYQGEA